MATAECPDIKRAFLASPCGILLSGPNGISGKLQRI